MGRNQQWKLIHRGDLSLPFKDIVWHAGKAWATNDYGLWCIEKEKIKSVELPSEITICAGNLSTADGVMLIAGSYGAAFHNGEKWEIISIQIIMKVINLKFSFRLYACENRKLCTIQICGNLLPRIIPTIPDMRRMLKSHLTRRIFYPMIVAH